MICCGYVVLVVFYVMGCDFYWVNIWFIKDVNLVELERFCYVGKVYCVNVINYVVFVRRNGCVVWCG